jgi:flagellar hook assembly protein FlgD
MGLSGPLSLAVSQTAASAWNNVFDPLKGQQATIKYAVQSAGHLTIKVYTMNGVEVSTIFDGQVSPGSGSVNWAGRNLRSYVVASGIYLVRVQGPGLSKTLKVAVVK